MNSRPRSLLRVGTALESLHVSYLGSSAVGSSLPYSGPGPVGMIQRTAPLPRPTEEIQLNSGKQYVMNAKQEVQA